MMRGTQQSRMMLTLPRPIGSSIRRQGVEATEIECVMKPKRAAYNGAFVSPIEAKSHENNNDKV